VTPEQALQILEQASSQAALPKQGHVACMQALEVLKKALEAKSEDKKED
jgi:hypothetical protein